MVEPQPSKLTTWVRFPSSAPVMNLFELIRTLYKYQLKFWVDFFCKNHPTMERMVFMLNIIREEVTIDESLKKKS